MHFTTWIVCIHVYVSVHMLWKFWLLHGCCCPILSQQNAFIFALRSRFKYSENSIRLKFYFKHINCSLKMLLQPFMLWCCDFLVQCWSLLQESNQIFHVTTNPFEHIMVSLSIALDLFLEIISLEWVCVISFIINKYALHVVLLLWFDDY